MRNGRNRMAKASNVILVHGAWADGSSWSKVIPLLLARGLRVTAVQLPLTSMKDDVATVKRALALEDGPTVLVGHSYGGAVITEAGNHPKVAGLVYIAAFAPNRGESVSSLIKDPPPGAPVPPILAPQGGFLFLDKAKFHASFAARRPPLLAVWGKNDPFFLPAGAEAFRRDIADADVRFFDTGHFALETHADEIAAAIRGFLAKTLQAA